MDERLKQIMENLTAAYDATEMVPASGRALDSLANARNGMRLAYFAVKDLLKEAAPDGR